MPEGLYTREEQRGMQKVGHGSEPCPFSQNGSDPPGPRRPIIDLALGLVASNPVTFLDFTDKLFILSLDAIQIIIGQLAPLLTNAPLELIPLPFQRVLVHIQTSNVCFDAGLTPCF